MGSNGNHRGRPLALASRRARSRGVERHEHGIASHEGARTLDWSILMAHAQAGEQGAYRRLLEEITPYVRSLAVKCHRDPRDVEDSVQDVLLTVHFTRHTYDPLRPFGPWLKAIANRRIIDRLRCHRRSTARETPLTEEHETFSTPEANYQSEAAARALHAAIERLPQRQRDAIRLLKLRELSLKEAAAVSGMSVAALKVAAHRAMKSLRHRFVKPDEGT